VVAPRPRSFGLLGTMASLSVSGIVAAYQSLRNYL